MQEHTPMWSWPMKVGRIKAKGGSPAWECWVVDYGCKNGCPCLLCSRSTVTGAALGNTILNSEPIGSLTESHESESESSQ